MLLGVAAPRHQRRVRRPPHVGAQRAALAGDAALELDEGDEVGGGERAVEEAARAHRCDVGGDGALGAELAHREELHLAAAVVGVERDVVGPPARGEAAAQIREVWVRAGRWLPPGGSAGGRRRRRRRTTSARGRRTFARRRPRGCARWSARSTSASARHSSGCGAGSSLASPATRPAPRLLAEARSSTEMTQRPDCSTFRHSTRSDDSTVSSPPRRCSTSTWIGAQLQQRVRAPQPAADPFSSPLAVIGASGSGGGAAGSIGAAEEGAVPTTAPSRTVAARAQPRLAELQRDVGVEAPCARSTIDCTKARPPRSERGASAPSTARPPTTARRPPRAAPPPPWPRRVEQRRRGGVRGTAAPRRGCA